MIAFIFLQSKPVTVLGSVQRSIEINNGKKFFGFYGLDFPKRCWISDTELLFSSVQWNEVKSYILNIGIESFSYFLAFLILFEVFITFKFVHGQFNDDWV